MPFGPPLLASLPATVVMVAQSPNSSNELRTGSANINTCRNRARICVPSELQIIVFCPGEHSSLEVVQACPKQTSQTVDCYCAQLGPDPN